MGTRRSKHNKGVKPLYKEHRQNMQVGEAYFVDGLSGLHPALAKAAPIRRSASAPRPNTPLEAEVVAYLEKRKQQNAVLEAERGRLADFNALTLAAAAFVRTEGQEDDRAQIVKISTRDVLLQLLARGDIFHALFGAGRTWQRYMEESVLQQCVTIDWSEPTRRATHYQWRGEITPRQESAMRVRRDFVNSKGHRLSSGLDFYLGFGQGIAELKEATGLSQRAVIANTIKLLHSAADFFAEVARPTVEADAHKACWRAA